MRGVRSEDELRPPSLRFLSCCSPLRGRLSGIYTLLRAAAEGRLYATMGKCGGAPYGSYTSTQIHKYTRAFSMDNGPLAMDNGQWTMDNG